MGDVCSEYCKAENIVIDRVNNWSDEEDRNVGRLLNKLEWDARLEGLIEARRECAEELKALSRRLSNKKT